MLWVWHINPSLLEFFMDPFLELNIFFSFFYIKLFCSRNVLWVWHINLSLLKFFYGSFLKLNIFFSSCCSTFCWLTYFIFIFTWIKKYILDIISLIPFNFCIVNMWDCRMFLRILTRNLFKILPSTLFKHVIVIFIFNSFDLSWLL